MGSYKTSYDPLSVQKMFQANFGSRPKNLVMIRNSYQWPKYTTEFSVGNLAELIFLIVAAVQFGRRKIYYFFR